MQPVTKTVLSADGTPITYYVLGRGPRTWLAAPAMGAPYVAMSRVYEPLSEDLRIVTWDMRGFHRSGVPADPRALDVARHVDDLEAVVEAEGLERFVLGGWSMGVPISLEYLARDARRVEGLVLVNGPYTAAFDQAIPVPGLGDAMARVLEVVGAPAGRLMNPLSARLLGQRGVGRLLQALGVIAREPEFFEKILADFRTVDWERYLVVARMLHEHDASPHLPKVRVPTLVTAGTRDLMIPVRTARQLVERVEGAELFVVEGGTHYTPAEFPELVAERIRRFLDERLPEL